MLGLRDPCGTAAPAVEEKKPPARAPVPHNSRPNCTTSGISRRFGDEPTIVIVAGHAGKGIVVLHLALRRGLVTRSFALTLLLLSFLTHLLELFFLFRREDGKHFLV